MLSCRISVQQCNLCSIIQPVRLSLDVFYNLSIPSDPLLDEKKNHFQKFKRLAGNKPTEKDLPSLKLVSTIFVKFLFFTKWWSFQNYEKYFLVHLKSSFCSRDIQIFVFPPSPIFLPVSHCLRAWSKMNLKDSDVANCLNKNLLKHFVWYLEKEKSMRLSLWPLIQY